MKKITIILLFGVASIALASTKVATLPNDEPIKKDINSSVIVENARKEAISIQKEDTNVTQKPKKSITPFKKKEQKGTNSSKVQADTNITNAKGLVPIDFGDYPLPAMQVEFDGYITAILIDTQGKRSQFLPSTISPDTYFKKDKTIAILDQDTVMEQLPVGLHYILIVASQERLILSVTTKKKKNISALEDDTALIKILGDIRLGQYGKFVMKMVPIYKQKD